jgi:hypothetical protein
MIKMNARKLIFAGLAALALILLSLGGGGRPALALTMTPSVTPGGLTISGVQPNLIHNTAAAELVVTGGGFADGAVVILGAAGALPTTYVSGNLLRAALHAGVAPGVYTVTVVNPNAAAASLPNSVTVTGPPLTPEPSATPWPTAFVRPLLVVSNYGASSAEIVPGSNLDFEMTLANAGQSLATNVVVTFVAGDFVARETGGVRALGTLAPGDSNRFWQPLFAERSLSGKTIATLEARVSYTDAQGTAYNESFALTFPVYRPPAAGPAATATPTPTPTPTSTPTATPTGTLAPRLRPQLIVTEYGADLAQLQPGSHFTLNLTAQNQGNAPARRVTLILGGGSAADGSVDGTPQSGGGLSGAGGEFSKFAPVGASNVQFMGDLGVGQSLSAAIRLVVNVTAEPGAYPVKVSFVYNDEAGGSYVDDQVITLLVYKRPSVEMSFYMPPPPFFTDEPASLPLQLMNTGSRTAVLGHFRVQAEGATLENNSVFIGSLEPGGFFPLDAFLIPNQPGPLDLILSVSYTDDFNQPQTLTQTITIEVGESFFPEEPFEPFPGEGFPFPEEEAQPETVWQRIWRFFLGLFGLSSGRQ